MSTAKHSTFAKTFNRLNSFLKEKGSLNDLGINANFEIGGRNLISAHFDDSCFYSFDPSLNSFSNSGTGKQETETTTVDLLSNMEKSINSLPQYVNLDDFASGETERKSEQMTIFYQGKVIVFDCISPEKAKNVMLAATGARVSSSNNQIQNGLQLASTSHCEGFGSGEQIRLPGLLMNGSDLPIARRASLHKFLAKRKDRRNVRVAPYQFHNPSSCHKFDLNLKM